MSLSANRFCPQCGTPLAPNATVCSTCGRNVAEPPPLPPTQLASPPSQNAWYPGSSAPRDQSPFAPPSASLSYPGTPSPGYAPSSQPPILPPQYASPPYGSLSYESNPYGSSGQSYAPPPQAAGSPYAAPSLGSSTSTVARPRPAGVTVLAVLVGLQALDDLLSLLVGLGSGDVIGIVVVGIFLVATITLGVGLWRLRPWAFWTAIVVEVIYLLIALLNLAQSDSPATLIERVIIEIVIPLVVLICLLAVRNVRAAIRGR